MKKLLLSLVMVATALCSAHATDVDVDLTAGKYDADAKTITWTVGEAVTIVQNQGTSTNAVNQSYIAKPRCYKGHYLTFQAAENIKVTGVEITYDGKYMGNDIVVGTEVADDVVAADASITANISTENGSTHTFTSADGVTVMYIQNTCATTNVQLRPTAIKVSYVEAEPEPFVRQTITALEQLDNNQAYIISDADGEGTVVYNPALSETNLMIAGSNNAEHPASKDEYKAAVDSAAANNAWQIVSVEGEYYLYNIGAKKFAASTGKHYFFTDVPTPMELSFREDGTFAVRTKGTDNQAYMCIAVTNNNNPVANWTIDDHGSILKLETADVATDDVAKAIKAYLAQQALNEELAAACSELGALLTAKVEASATGLTGLITSASQLSSPYTDPEEGSIAGAIDGNTNSFWHSTWHGGIAANGVHYLEIGFAEEVSGFMQMTMVRRSSQNDHLTKASIRGVKDGVETELAVVSLPFNASGETVTASFAMTEGQDTLRIYELATTNNRGYWHAAELQISKISLPADKETILCESYVVYSEALAIENATEENIKAVKAETLRLNVRTAAPIEAGFYAIAANIEGQLRAAITVPSDKGYGYPGAVDASLNDDGHITGEGLEFFEFVATEGGFHIKDALGRYIHLKGTYASVNVDTEVPTEGAVWIITTNEDGTVNIYNVEKGKIMQYSTKYSNYAFYDNVGGPLPTLYQKPATGTTGINGVEGEVEAGEAYTLQGVKATAGYRGIVVRGGKLVIK